VITKLQIDALVASKFDLYKSSVHFMNLNLENMKASMREEVESLCELAAPEICRVRCQHFNLEGVTPADYRERIIYLDDDLFFLAGIRFQGLDVTKPFVSVMPNFSQKCGDHLTKIRQLIASEFGVFSPTNFNITLPEGENVLIGEQLIDRYTIAGDIKELLEIKLAPRPEKLELIPLLVMDFYDDYIYEYKLLYNAAPFLRSEVKTESLDSLNESAKNGLLFKVLINDKCAGVIGGYIEDYFGQKEVCILEELLFSSYRGKGFGAYLQKAFAEKMLDRFSILWGHISYLNPASLKTALKNGRKITEIEYTWKI